MNRIPGEIDTIDDLRRFAEMVEPRGPTVREYQEALGLASTSAATYHLRHLEEQGLIAPSDGASRGTWLTQKGYRLLVEDAGYDLPEWLVPTWAQPQ